MERGDTGCRNDQARCKFEVHEIDEKVQKHDEQKEEEESQLWASTGTA